MNSINNKMIEAIESFGPQLFAIKGSISIWTSIIQSVNQKKINQLIQITDNMNSTEKFNLAKRILSVGFDNVFIELNPNHRNSDNSNELQINQLDEDIVHDSEDEHSIEYDVVMDSSDNYVEASALLTDNQLLSQTSNKSYKTAFTSSQTQSQEMRSNLNSNLTEERLSVFTRIESHLNKTPQNMDLESSDNYSQSQRSQWSEESIEPSGSRLSGSRFSGTPITLSPITPFCSQKTQTQSPTTSLTISSTIGLSPKSSSTSPRSQRRSSPVVKSPQKLIEEYKSLIPYDSYCSEKVYFNDSDCNSGQNNSNAILSENLLENIIEENVKDIELFKDEIED
jgi:hypothetical protein